MPTVELYASMPNGEINSLIASRLGYKSSEVPWGGAVLTNSEGEIIYRDRTVEACNKHIPQWTGDANLAFSLFDYAYIDLYHKPGGEWIGVCGFIKYSSFDVCRVMCVLWLTINDIPVRNVPPTSEAF